MTWLWKKGYKPIADESESGMSSTASGSADEELASFLQSSSEKKRPAGSRSCSLGLTLLTIGNIILFLVSSTHLWTQYQLQKLGLNSELRKTSTWSPIHDLVDLEMRPVLFNGSLFARKDAGIARQSPNPEADKIWDEYDLTRVFPVTKADIIKLGKDPETAVKLENDLWGLGDDAYATILDVYHQIHCVNSLRRIAYTSYYKDKVGEPQTETLHEIHINHCVDILLQALQCSGNVNLITLHWVETQPYPYPDMSINRQCINFDQLTAWRKENTIDMDKYVKVMRKPPGLRQIPAPKVWHDFWDRMNITNQVDNPDQKGQNVDVGTNYQTL